MGFNSAFKGLMQFCECVKKLTVVTNHSNNSQQNSSLHNSNVAKIIMTFWEIYMLQHF